MFRLFLLFTIIPAVELWLLFRVGERIGFFETIYLIILTGIIGAGMAKREGVRVIQDLQQSMGKGMPPGQKIVEGLLVLVGGLLLITPGIMTDLFGFSLIFPFTRTRLAPLIQAAASQSMKQNPGGFKVNFGPMSAGPAYREEHPDQPTVEIKESPSSDTEKKMFNHPTF